MPTNSGFTVKKVRSLQYLKSLQSKNTEALSLIVSQYRYNIRKQFFNSVRQAMATFLIYTVSAGLIFYPFLSHFQNASADPTTSLTVINNVNNSFGGTAAPSDFSVTVNGTNVSNSSFSGSSGGVTVNLDAGIFTVSASGPSGYSSAYAGCFGNIHLGDTKTCTITSSDQQAGVQVITQVLNANGGTKQPADFTFNVTGTNATPTSAPGDAGGTMVNLNAGVYSIAEPVLAGYTQSLSADCNGTLASGEVKFCTITNSDAVLPTTASLSVINNVVNANGGSATAADFTANITGSTTPSTFTTSAAGTPVIVQPGSYGVSVSGPSNYSYVYSVDCFATVIAGDSKTCTVTSNDIAPPTTSDISITSVATSTTPSAGDTVSYTLTVRNNGLASATNVVATDTLPSGLTYQSNTPSQGSYDGTTGQWAIGSLASGVSATLTLNASVNIATGGQTLTNNAVVAADQTDPVPANNATSVNVTVNNLAPVLSNEITPQASTNSITITWTTDHPATSRVIYDTSSHAVLGAAPNYGYPNSTVEDSTLVLNHSVTITGLIAGTTYFFRPVSHGSPEAVGGEVNSATSASGGSGGSGGGSFGSVSSTVSSGNTTTTPVAISPFQGLAFDQNAANNEQGQVLGASTNVPSGDPNTLPKTGVPPEGLVLLILAAATVGVVRYKYYQI